MSIQFKNEDSKKVYEQFLTSLETRLKGLKKSDRIEIQKELSSHIYESMNSSEDKPELEKLLGSIEKLGSLDDITQPIVADYMIRYAGSTLNPTVLLNAFAANKGRSVQRFVIGGLLIVFSILTLTFVMVSLLKLFRPDMGLYIGRNVFVLGTVDRQTQAKEILGYWIIPIAGVLTVLLLWMASRTLKFITREK
jgi:uncharacterized membrane protein